MPRDPKAHTAIHDAAWRMSRRQYTPGGPMLDPIEASTFYNDDQPMKDYNMRRRAMLDQWDTWAASGGEDAGGFWRGLIGGFFK